MVIRLVFGFLLLQALTIFAQDVRVNGNSTQNEVFKSTNASTTAQDRVGVQGTSVPTPYYGIGVQADGGWIGVRGRSMVSGTGNRTGVLGDASGGTQYNYGVHGNASGSGAYAGYFSGNVYVSGTLTQGSDLALKQDVNPMGPALGKVMSLKPKTYTLNQAEFKGMNLPAGKKFGLVAQDVEGVLPEVVTQVVHPPKDKNSPPIVLKGLDYLGIVPVLVKALQEQQVQIEALQAEIKAIKQ